MTQARQGGPAPPQGPAGGRRRTRRDLVLVEPLHHEELLDRPNLGCAMLLGACRAAGLAAGLVEGQPRLLADLVDGGVAEFWSLLHDLSPAEVEELQLAQFLETCDRLGLASLDERLAGLYRDLIVVKDPRRLLDGRLTQDLARLVRVYVKTCRHRLRRAPREPLSMVDGTVAAILAQGPRVVGFSLQGEWDEIGRAVRARLRERSAVPIVGGGPLTAFAEPGGLQPGLRDEGIDWLVLGEGELLLPEVVRRATLGGDVGELGGVIAASSSGQSAAQTTPPAVDVAALPTPDFSDYDLGRFLAPVPVLPLQTARGCSWRRCAFCSHHTMYAGRYRPVPVPSVVETLRRLQDTYGVSHFTLHDEEVPPARARRLAGAILEAGLDLRFNLYGRLVEGFDDDVVEQLGRAGCRSVEWGLESGSERVLSAMRKGTRPATMSRVVRRFAQNGIANQCFIVVGFPGETAAEADETVAFLRDHADAVQNLLLNLFQLDPASPVGRDPAAWGVESTADGEWTTRNGMQPAQAADYLRRLQAEMALDASAFLASPASAAWGNDGRMLRFVAACLAPLRPERLAELMQTADWEALYVVAPGNVRREAAGRLLQPLSLTESPFVNRIRPPAPVPLDGSTLRAVELADGTRSVAQIAAEAGAGGVGDGAGVTAFLRDRLLLGQAVAFSEPWPAPSSSPPALSDASRPERGPGGPGRG